MKQFRKEPRYVSALVVHVPDVMGLIDMLRYDRCCPATEDESRKLWRMLSITRGGEPATPADHIIRLHRFAPSNTPATAERWRSFECTVLDERSPDEPEITDRELAAIMLKIGIETEYAASVLRGIAQ